MDFTKIADRLNRIWLTLKTPPPSSPQTSAVVVAGDNAAAPTSTTTSAAAAAAISTGAGGDHQHQPQSPIAEEVGGGDVKSTGDKENSDMSASAAAATASKLVKSAYPKQQMIQLHHSNQPYSVPGQQFSLPLGSPAPGPPPPQPPPHLPLNISSGGGGGAYAGGGGNASSTTTTNTSSATSSAFSSQTASPAHPHPHHPPHLPLQHQSSAGAGFGGLPPHPPLTGVSSSSGGASSFPHYQQQQQQQNHHHHQHSILVNSSSQPIMTNQHSSSRGQHQQHHHHHHSTSTSSVTSPHNLFTLSGGGGGGSNSTASNSPSSVVSPTPPTPSSSHYPPQSHHGHHPHSHHHPHHPHHAHHPPPLSAGASLPPLTPSHGGSSFSAAQTPESPSLSSSGFKRQLSLNIFRKGFGAGGGGGGGGRGLQLDFSGRRDRPSFSGTPSHQGQNASSSSSVTGTPLFGGAADSNLIDYHSLSPRPRPKNLGLSNSHDNLIGKNVSLFSNNNNNNSSSNQAGGSPFGGLSFGGSSRQQQQQQQHRSPQVAFDFTNSPVRGGGGGGGGGGVNHARSQIFYPNPSSSRLKEEFASKNNRTIKLGGKQYENIKEDDFQRLSELGAGSFGKCAAAATRTTTSTSSTTWSCCGSALTLRTSSSVTGYYIMETEVWIFMELMTTCFDRLLKRLGAETRVPEQIIGKIVVSTVSTLDYLKDRHGVIHRDIKPSNILINRQGVIKLCDFGISGRLIDSKAHSRSVGCAAYMAPERIQPPDSTGSYDIRSDVWSLGITLVEIATGRFPYQDFKSDFELLSKVIQEEPPTLSTAAGFSPDIKNFIDKCLTKDYTKRPKYKELMATRFYLDYLDRSVDVADWFRCAYDESESSTRTSTSSLASSGQVNHF
ncbi:Dual specificity mitogen-activated protein kinase kinase 7 [Tyrophagus putrescentiae]|nr:Dual specificity mitogen-activated protein kinase kinase 7 [Tyrophagus putrescentiae]